MRIRFSLLALLIPLAALAQIQPAPIRSGPALPATCAVQKGIGELKWFYNTSTQDFCRCVEPNTWECLPRRRSYLSADLFDVGGADIIYFDNETFIGARFNAGSCVGGTRTVRNATASIPYPHLELTNSATGGSCVQQDVAGVPTTVDFSHTIVVNTSGSTTANVFVGLGSLSGLGVPCGNNFAAINQPEIGFRAEQSTGTWQGVITDTGGGNVACNTGVPWTVSHKRLRFEYTASTGVAKFYVDDILKCSATKTLAFSTLGVEACVVSTTSSQSTLKYSSQFWRYKMP